MKTGRLDVAGFLKQALPYDCIKVAVKSELLHNKIKNRV